ncbi:DEAD/DEAH box helicase [Lihuaxuella thermophila]|uniref:Predicted helicase n=1 Tax=Lihuaxuella thermophila TaxID=1173111 RepID=A0A1H8AVB4_9BACL|nr:type ISP restriction/modification enzyme [Lihuaxuella thermophila]SEM74503.1 Predicted helicase [Lihuaxuella thermophila]
MNTIYDILDQLRQVARNTREQGDLFERLMASFLRIDPQYKQLFSQVWRWMDWPGRDGRVDTGIDLVAEEAGTGEIWAIQCKFYEPGHKIQKGELDSFFTESGKNPFHKRMIIATAPMSKHAEDACHDQQIPVTILDMEALEKSPIDWSRFSWSSPEELRPRQKKTLRPHQETAISDVIVGFETHDRGKLIMACGTGKTFTSLKLTERMVPTGGLVLFLVPSIALLSQTLREWTAESEIPLRSFAVCSDKKVGKKEGEDLRASDLAYPATTDPDRLVSEVIKGLGNDVLTVIFSTYQSIDVVSEAQKAGLPSFDLVICDEAHRTTGVVRGGEASYFTKVHEDSFLRAKKRLYMTATPRIYTDASKSKAKDANVPLYSMDNEEKYGPEFHRLNFSKAVESGILSDYKVIVLAVDEQHILHHLGHKIHDKDDEVTLDDAAKIVGCWNALSKRLMENETDQAVDPMPMHRAVAFSNSIKNSKRVTELFARTIEEYCRSLPGDTENLLVCEVNHVDGTHNIVERNSKLQWLKENAGDNTCRILSNARCLTEGVDVPSLDAVIFLNPRDSQVDVVQAVGRVMRKAPGKQYGYVILPIAVSSEDSPEEALNKNQNYRVVWEVLNALRAHDDRFNDLVNKLELNKRKPDKIQVIGVGGGGKEGKDGEQEEKQQHEQLTLGFEKIKEWRDVIYAKIVQKCGERRYWENWAKDVAEIAERHNTHIRTILDSSDPKAKEAQQAFADFLKGLQRNINESIGQEEAIEMLAQHLVTKPVFDALFENYAFSSHNPVSQTMQKVLDVLEEHALWKETESLEDFYKNVRKRASGIDNAEGKQKIIIELYDKFFRTAFPKMAERLGIVYTPTEVVDFILKSADDVLQEEFGIRLSDKGVHILDPFTGTGTFIVRLLQSGLIQPEDLVRKYREELHANEIVLLPYYIAAINIEEAFHRLSGQDYEPFPGIVLTDTFQLGEDNDSVSTESLFPENNERIARQKQQEIRVIVGNPPYSVGQGSQNDNNQNLSYYHLEKRIMETYAAESKAVSKKALYDSYILAIRWASDRIGDQGVIAFVTNGSFIDSNTTDGLRKCLAEEFTAIYCFNLRGNQRTSGEQSRKEGGKIFGSGSRAPIAITVLVKNPAKKGSCVIRYHDIGDYLSREQKLNIIRQASSVKGLNWTIIQPNKENDWINQRSDDFLKLIPLRPQTENEFSIFDSNSTSTGVVTSRDSWTYNFSHTALQNNMKAMIDFYNRQVDEFISLGKADPTMNDVNDFIDTDPRKISWSRALKQNLRRGKKHPYDESSIIPAMYRPFCKQWLYFSRAFNEVVSKMPDLFPNPSMKNRVITVTGIGASKDFSVLMTDSIPNFHFLDTGQCFPLHFYDQPGGLFGHDQYIRRDSISDWALKEFRKHYNDEVHKEDIFYYVYGVLHSPEYKERFAPDLKKMLPRIPLVPSAERFWSFSRAGRELADLHLNYETVDPWPLNEIHDGNLQTDDFYRVEKMRFAKGQGGKPDKTTIIYNANITLSGIPLEAYNYVVNGKPAIEWIMDRYQVKTDKDSGIVNDPNQWSEDARYIVDLVKRIVRVSMETLRILKSLPELDLA